jgi:hypothetical protein
MSLLKAMIAPIAGVFTKALDIIDKFVPDKDLAAKLKAEMQMRMLELAQTELLTALQGQIDIITAEIKGESWMQRNWRPTLMMVCIAIIFNNFVFAPYIGLFFPDKQLMLELPGGLWALLNVGVGGYIGARTVEKIKGVAEDILPKIIK